MANITFRLTQNIKKCGKIVGMLQIKWIFFSLCTTFTMYTVTEVRFWKNMADFFFNTFLSFWLRTKHYEHNMRKKQEPPCFLKWWQQRVTNKRSRHHNLEPLLEAGSKSQRVMESVWTCLILPARGRQSPLHTHRWTPIIGPSQAWPAWGSQLG